MNKSVFTWYVDTMSRPKAGVLIWRTSDAARTHEVVDLSTPYCGRGVWDAVREVIEERSSFVRVVDHIDQELAPFETVVETHAEVERDKEGKFVFKFAERCVVLSISSKSSEGVPIESQIEKGNDGTTCVRTRFSDNVTFASITSEYFIR